MAYSAPFSCFGNNKLAIHPLCGRAAACGGLLRSPARGRVLLMPAVAAGHAAVTPLAMLVSLLLSIEDGPQHGERVRPADRMNVVHS